MNILKITPWVFLVTVWLTNINDLIRGPWFYHGTSQILFMNLMGVLALIVIVMEKKEKKK